MTTLDLDAINALRTDGFQLTTGHHDPSKGEGCAMDLIAWQTTGQVTDMPGCVHPILARLVHRINDDPALSGDDRWRIVTECGPLLVGSDEWPVDRALWVVSVAGRTVGGLFDALSRSANLARANLTGANLAGANLARANLTRANLAGANLTGAYLAGADLARANLTEANLTRADLAGANLTGAYLAGADLTGAYLTGAYLAGADLTGANLTGAVGNSLTRLPDGWHVTESGLIERVAS